MTSSLRARSSVGIAALLLTGLLAGCNDEKDPPDASEPSSEPVATEATSAAEPTTTHTGPVEPTLPAAAKEETKAGAEAFVEYYWDVVNYATKSGDVRLLTTLAQPSCNTCAAGLEGIAEVYQRGGQIVGGDYTVLQLNPVASGGGDWAVTMHTRVGPQRTIGAGALNGEFPGGHAKWLIGLARIDGAWSVATLESL